MLQYLLFSGLLLWPALLAATTAPDSWAKANVRDLLPLYRKLHQNPELSYQETKTAEFIATQWKTAGAEVTTGVGGNGVVGVIRNGAGPTVMLRTDLDALPVVEATGLEFASQVRVKDASGNEVGVMHACGHDIHMTNLIGVTRFLTQQKSQWSGTVLLVGQPAEEKGMGALKMLGDGLFKRFPKPDYALALHVDPTLPTGTIGYRPGFAMATADSVDITMQGRGGHGAAPESTVDPIVQCAQLVMDLQTLVSRETSPTEPTVITVGSIHAGTKHNIIPDSCHLQLTVRTGKASERKRILDGISRKAAAVAAGAGARKPQVDIDSDPTPSLMNDAKLVERIVPVFQKLLGSERVELVPPAMVSEDFSQYGLQGVPIFMFRLGSLRPERLKTLLKKGESISLHSSVYYPDAEETLVTGISAMGAAVLALLGKGG